MPLGFDECGLGGGSVRARAMSRRRIGSAALRDLAQRRGLDEATAALARTSYGHDVSIGQDLISAQRAIVASVVWNLRVLAGWQPLRGVAIMRLLFGAIEAANVHAHLEQLRGAEPRPAYRLGALGTVWPRVARTSTPEQVRDALATSVWGDPGGTTPREIALGMRTDLADRVVGAVPDAVAAWAAGNTALVLAREEILQGRRLPDRAQGQRRPGSRSGRARSAHAPRIAGLDTGERPLGLGGHRRAARVVACRRPLVGSTSPGTAPH